MRVAEHLETSSACATGKIRTLVVDDPPFMLKMMVQTLEQNGNFDIVGTASNGAQGFRYALTLSPELVLMDVHMPRLNGLQATRYIKERESPPVVVLVTSDDSLTARTMSEEAGADGFVIKQGNLRRELITTLENLFGPKWRPAGENQQHGN